jgi:hypothetical protein
MRPKFENILKQIKDDFEVKIRIYKFPKKECYSGTFEVLKQTIHVNKNSNKSNVKQAQTICHELGHAYCYLYNKYPIYHYHIRHYKPKNRKQRRAFILKYKQTMLRAEKYVDNLGEQFYKHYFPHYKKPFYKAYHIQNQKLLKKFLLVYNQHFIRYYER